MARHHQTSLSDAAELPLHQFGMVQGRSQIFFGIGAGKAALPIFEREFLKFSQGEKKSIIVDRDERISANPLFHPQRDHARERIIRAPADQRMEKEMAIVAVAI